MDKLPVVVLSLSILVLMYFIDKIIKAVKYQITLILSNRQDISYLKARVAQLESKLNIVQVNKEASKEKPPRA